MRKRLSYQVSDTLFIKGILLMALLVILHQLLSRQTAFIAQIGTIALGGFCFWALIRIIDQWQWAHPQRMVEFDDTNLFIRQGSSEQTIPLAAIVSVASLPPPKYGLKRNVLLQFSSDEAEIPPLTLSIAAEDWPVMEELVARIAVMNQGFENFIKIQGQG